MDKEISVDPEEHELPIQDTALTHTDGDSDAPGGEPPAPSKQGRSKVDARCQRQRAKMRIHQAQELSSSSDRETAKQAPTTRAGLQNKLELTLTEKCQAVTNLDTVREHLRETREELLKEKHENTVLIADTVQQKKLLGKYNRVSQFAVEEYKALYDAMNLERDLRTEAKNFARAMVVEQKKLKTQSEILMQSSSPSQALQEALSQVTRLTQDLETQGLEHQKQIKQLEDRLRTSEAWKELTSLRHKLELVEEEKREYSDKCSKAEMEVKDLQFTVEELQKKMQAATNPPPALAPPPPTPLPPLSVPAVASNPLSSLLSLIRK
ncbi:hypothetical protein ABVT39_014190 [Epinephelus coioides]